MTGKYPLNLAFFLWTAGSKYVELLVFESVTRKVGDTQGVIARHSAIVDGLAGVLLGYWVPFEDETLSTKLLYWRQLNVKKVCPVWIVSLTTKDHSQ